MPTTNELPRGKPLLAVAHPGHELRVYHWLERARPDVMILTDGSGHSGRSRLARTIELLGRVGARPTELRGAVADQQLYAAVLRQDFALFVSLARRMAKVIDHGGYDYIVGDASEGTILGHDLFRGLLDTAIAAVRAKSGREILNLDFPLEAEPDSVHPALLAGTYRLELDPPAVERKLAACRGYTELAHEVEAALRVYGRDAFALECLRPAISESGISPFIGLPAYEVHGAKAVAEGRYQEVVRYQEHVRPVLEALYEAFSLPVGGGVATA